MDCRVAVGIISFNSMPFLIGAIATMYPYAAQILVADGPVRFWQDQGHSISTDGTLEALIDSTLDPDRKITLIVGQWPEKDEQSNACMGYVRDDISHIWVVDPDELYRATDVELVLRLLDRYDVVRFRPYNFVGGFDKCVPDTNARQRILRYYPGAQWEISRPPTILDPGTGRPWHETGRVLAGEVLERMGIRMYHYSHVFDHQVKARAAYYGRHPAWRIQPLVFKGEHPRWIEEMKEELARVYDYAISSQRSIIGTIKYSGAA